jgi:DNA-binding Xre family transcriptional regulator
MTMLTPDQIKTKLKPMNVSEVSRSTGISRLTLHRFIHDIEKRTTYDMIKKLSDYLESL